MYLLKTLIMLFGVHKKPWNQCLLIIINVKVCQLIGKLVVLIQNKCKYEVQFFYVI